MCIQIFDTCSHVDYWLTATIISEIWSVWIKRALQEGLYSETHLHVPALSDLDKYLNTHFGISDGDMLVAHIL